MNRNFVKPREDMTPEFAPDVLEINGRKVYSPKAVHCRIAGYLPLSPDYPVNPPEGKHYAHTDKIERDGAGYRWVYALVDNPPPPPRRWTRLSIKTALAQAGMLSQALEFLSGVEIETGYSAASALTDCDYIEEGYPTAERWNALLDGAGVALEKTREEIDAFLDAIPTEG
ncbi:MAG: hypothetical protein K6G94_09635 [Kiritimatiellae bacterium]|nr:hypothetical protein [Kiritimatiellia bacterium]